MKAVPREFLISPYFRGLPPRVLGEMARLFREKSFARGDTILREGSRAHRLFILAQGTVVLSIGRGRADLITEIVKKKGSLFGWSSLVPPRKYTATAKAMEDCRIFWAEGRDLEKFFQKYPSWGWLFLKRLTMVIAARLSQTRALLAETLS